MKEIGVDSWAFIEMELNGPLAKEVADLVGGADFVVTAHDVVVETFNFLCRKPRSTAIAWDWWEGLNASSTRILYHPLDELHRFVAKHGRSGRLSLTDYSLALAAKSVKVKDIATSDREFASLGLNPLYAKKGD